MIETKSTSAELPAAGDLESTGDDRLDSVLMRFAGVVEDLMHADLESLIRLDGPSTGLHAAGRVFEALRRRLAAFDAAYVTAVERGDEPARHAKTSTVTFLRDQLLISTAEARRRVALAHACTPQRAFSGGDLLPARLPILAAAVAAGTVSDDHAAVVLAIMDAVPPTVGPDDVRVIETAAVDAARVSDPARLARWGVEALNRIDPDGALRDYHYAHAHRGITVTPHRGRPGGTIRGTVDVELLEKFQIIFDALAGPRPAAAGDGAAGERPEGDDADPADQARVDRRPELMPDDRPPDARRHDAVSEAFSMVLSGGDLPACGGMPATVVLHLVVPETDVPNTAVPPADMPRADAPPTELPEMTAPDSTTSVGFGPTAMAITDHGNRFPVREALRMADQAVVYTLLKSTRDVPLTLGRATRIATPGQTVALAARDRGCSFPGCDRPPALCQRHHIKPWLPHGPTDVANLTLLCGYHHRNFEQRGWRVVMIGGHPRWIPPRWIDPHQDPIRNHAHDYPDTG